MQRAALLSVSDRTGLVEFAKGLSELGFKLLSTTGTSAYLAKYGIIASSIEKYINQPEILDGRVKTLHPKIYAGILARRDRDDDMEELSKAEIIPIDVIAVNLYPFSANRGGSKTQEEMVELIDIGGPSMIRAAAKNHSFVYPVVDPADYPVVLEALTISESAAAIALRKRLANKVFVTLARDTLDIAEYFASEPSTSTKISLKASNLNSQALPVLGEVLGTAMVRSRELRYGENSHQAAAFYSHVGQAEAPWSQLSGKELSYNNILDVDAAIKLIAALPKKGSCAVIIKHTNPCGVGQRPTQIDALRAAKLCDPRSHFGGIIAFTEEVNEETAKEIREDFAEIVVAPAYSAAALAVLKTSKALRVLSLNSSGSQFPFEFRSALGGVLVQTSDHSSSSIDKAECVSAAKANAAQMQDLALAWSIVPHVKSNAIVLIKDGLLIGVGAGQMSRIDSVEIAISKALRHGHDIAGAVAASDAFFPFPDNIEAMSFAGVKAIIAPKGSKKDADSIAAANREGVVLLFAEDRHFRH